MRVFPSTSRALVLSPLKDQGAGFTDIASVYWSARPS